MTQEAGMREAWSASVVSLVPGLWFPHIWLAHNCIVHEASLMWAGGDE